MFTTKHMFSDLFDVKNNFDVTMIAVFSAREDWYSWAKLMHSEHKLFILKQIVVQAKEINSLLSQTLFKKYNSEISKFSNYSDIKTKKEEYEKQCNTYYEILEEPRNNIVHYSKHEKIMKPYYNSKDFENFEFEIQFGDTEGDIIYGFPLELCFKYLLHNYNKHGLGNDYRDMLNSISDFSILVVQLLDAIIEGYLSKKLHLDDENNH